MRLLLALALALLACSGARAQEANDTDLAKQLANPVAALISVPIQMNYDSGIGPQEGWKLQTNIQPVIPFAVNDDWNLITRTIMPVIYQDDILPGSGSDFGLGDINMSLFFSPREPTSGGVIWGAGPVLLFPTATESLLGGKKWGAGPALVVLTMLSFLSVSVYVPFLTITVSPAFTLSAAFWMVLNGALELPLLLSLPVGDT